MFFLTTLHPEKRERSTCVGFFSTQVEAEEVLLKNWGDLNEVGFLPYAVVEEGQPGLYPELLCVSWWQYDRMAGCWVRAERPSTLEDVVNFAIG